VAPGIVVLLGGSAAKEVLGVTEGIMRLRGKWRDVEFGRHRAPPDPWRHPLPLVRRTRPRRVLQSETAGRLVQRPAVAPLELRVVPVERVQLVLGAVVLRARAASVMAAPAVPSPAI
jgi:hypothetical protein